MRYLMPLAAMAILLAGCGPSGKDVIDTNRAAVEARIKMIEEFAGKVSAGTAEQTELKLPDGVKLKFKADGQPGNAMDIPLEEAEGSKASLDYVHGGGDLVIARDHLKGQRLDKGDYVQNTVDCLMKPRFLVIVKNTSLTLPEATGDGETFRGGNVDFEVYAYDMQEKKELGMVKGSAQSGDSAIARTKHSVNTDQDLKSSMAMHAGLALAKVMGPYTD